MEAVSNQWDTLVLGVESITWGYLRQLIEELWPKAVGRLAEFTDADVAGPSQRAWFHVRRTTALCPNRVEVLRLRRAILSTDSRESVRVLGETMPGVTLASWCPEAFEPRHDNPFLSFLQKLSVLRAMRGICCQEYLGKVSKPEYDKCPHVQAAYEVMMSPNTEWYGPLSPWFDHMEHTQMSRRMTYEYAHWFGHIISGWENTRSCNRKYCPGGTEEIP